MSRFISVLLGCSLVALAVMPGTYSFWHKRIEMTGIVQIEPERQNQGVPEGFAVKAEMGLENTDEAGSGGAIITEGQSENDRNAEQQNAEQQNDEQQNDEQQNAEQQNDEVLGNVG